MSGGVPFGQRPEGANLFEAIKSREVSVVVALKLDRLPRSTVDCLETVQQWDKARVSLHLIDFNGAQLDTWSAMGRMMLTMGAAFAEMERSLIGERTSAALPHLKAHSTRLGGVPFGVTTDSPGGALVPVPAEREAVREILCMRRSGVSTTSTRGKRAHKLRSK